MVYCSIEEPLQKNEQLYWLDEDTGKTVLATEEVAELNRYGFLMGQAATEADQIIALVSEHARAEPQQLAAWRQEASKGARGLRRKKLERLGWCVHEGGGLDLCIRQAADWPNDNHARTSVLLWAQEVNHLVDPAWALLAAGRCVPGRSLMDKLIASGWTLAYVKRDNLGRAGLIVITPLLLSRQEIADRGLCHRLFEGGDAHMLWRQGMRENLE